MLLLSADNGATRQYNSSRENDIASATPLAASLIGRFTATIYELGPLNGMAWAQDVTRVDNPGQLESLMALLAADCDHGERLAAGDECLVHRVPPGEAAGLLWVNFATHTDQYLGGWSRPTAQTAYYNQLMVSPEHRRQGIGQALVRSAAHRVLESGSVGLRSAVLSGNAASQILHESLGFHPLARVSGIRAGGLTIRIPTRADATANRA